MGEGMSGSDWRVSRKRDPPTTPKAQRATGPRQKGELSCDFPEEAGGQARNPQMREGNLARLHSGSSDVGGGDRRGLILRTPHPLPTRPPFHALPGPSGERRRGLLVTDLRAKLIFPSDGGVPLKDFTTRTAQQPPTSTASGTTHLTEVSGCDWLKLPTAGPLGRKRRLSSVSIGQHSCQSSTHFGPAVCLTPWIGQMLS